MIEIIQKNKIQGYLTVYITLIMTILLSLCLTLIEGARYSTIRMEAELIAEIGMDSILAEFHRELLEQYNLFFIDTSYGTSTPSCQFTQEHLKHYLEKNCKMNEVFLGDWFYQDLLSLNIDNVQINRIRTAIDNNGKVLRNQAIEAIKDDIGISYLEKMKEWINTIEEYHLDTRDIETEREKIENQIQQYEETLQYEEIYKETEGQISEENNKKSIQNPAKNLGSIRSDGILKMVIEDTQKLSQIEINREQLISKRIQDNQVSHGNDNEEVAETGWEERLLFQEYLLRYCGYYGKEQNKGSLQYESEYLIVGKMHDIDNLKGVVYRISAIREAANAVYLFGDKVKCAEAELIATAAASAVMLPEIMPLLKVSILLGWAYMESLYDIKILLSGGKVPLLKKTENWHYDIGCIFGGEKDTKLKDYQEGLCYKDYLYILFFLTDLEILTYRFMDIVELDIQQTPGNSSFRLDGCIDRVEAEIVIKSSYGYELTITKKRGYL